MKQVLASLALLALAACAQPHHPRATLATTITPAGLQVVPRVSTGLGGVRVGVSPYGGHMGTNVGPVRLGVGF